MTLTLRFIARKKDRCPESTGHDLYLIMPWANTKCLLCRYAFLLVYVFRAGLYFFVFKMHIRCLCLREKESQEKLLCQKLHATQRAQEGRELLLYQNPQGPMERILRTRVILQ